MMERGTHPETQKYGATNHGETFWPTPRPCCQEAERSLPAEESLSVLIPLRVSQERGIMAKLFALPQAQNMMGKKLLRCWHQMWAKILRYDEPPALPRFLLGFFFGH